MNQLPKIVGVRFSKIGKSYYFDASAFEEIEIGDQVVVQTSRGWQLGTVAELIDRSDSSGTATYKSIERLATKEDIEKKNRLDEKANQAISHCQTEIAKIQIKGVKIINAEYSFDDKSISMIYASELNEFPKINELRKSLKKYYPDKKIDFHKIGPRDVARFYGGMGACGLKNRCCELFLKEFDSISIRMAKTQGISLTPSDITGMCDRLRCCLNYEFCQYEEILKTMPRRNKMVKTPLGIGKVKDLAPLMQTVQVEIDEIGLKHFKLDEVEEIKQSRNIHEKAALNQKIRRKQKKK
jgi:cell fate regulator YaaT (PSP1 superfamily)